ncbi:MAG: TraB/GumN family protein [Acidobacteriota bacterium]
MKKFNKPALILILFFFIFTSESIGKSFLWEIEVNGNKSYILGSVHMMKKEVYPLKSELEEGFSRCDFLVVEADISTEKLGEILKITMEKAKYKNNSTLKDHISVNTYKIASKKLDELGMSLKYFNNFKPWFLAMTVTSMELVKQGLDPNLGIDKYFINKAGDKKILELEGVEFQLDMFDNFSDAESDKFLLSSLRDATELGKEIDTIVEAWKAGDTDAIERLLIDNKKDFPGMEKLFKIILDERNERMVKKIESYFQTGDSYFIIAGAAHLVGKKGIIKMLEKKGYKLKQI